MSTSANAVANTETQQVSGKDSGKDGQTIPANVGDKIQDDSIEQLAEIKYLYQREAKFSTTPGGVLSLKLGEEEYNKVDLYLAFPFTLEHKLISVRNEKGDEIGMIKDLEDFDSESKDAILMELQWRYYSPQILRILNIKDEFGYLHWDTETDRGYRKFVTRGREDGIQMLSETRLLVTDMTGNRFEIPNFEELDAKSVRYLESLV